MSNIENKFSPHSEILLHNLDQIATMYKVKVAVNL